MRVAFFRVSSPRSSRHELGELMIPADFCTFSFVCDLESRILGDRTFREMGETARARNVESLDVSCGFSRGSKGVVDRGAGNLDRGAPEQPAELFGRSKEEECVCARGGLVSETLSSRLRGE